MSAAAVAVNGLGPATLPVLWNNLLGDPGGLAAAGLLMHLGDAARNISSEFSMDLQSLVCLGTELAKPCMTRMSSLMEQPLCGLRDERSAELTPEVGWYLSNHASVHALRTLAGDPSVSTCQGFV